MPWPAQPRAGVLRFDVVHERTEDELDDIHRGDDDAPPLVTIVKVRRFGFVYCCDTEHDTDTDDWKT